MPHEAMGDYEAAKAGAGNRVETFGGFWWRRRSSQPVWGGST